MLIYEAHKGSVSQDKHLKQVHRDSDSRVRVPAAQAGWDIKFQIAPGRGVKRRAVIQALGCGGAFHESAGPGASAGRTAGLGTAARAAEEGPPTAGHPSPVPGYSPPLAPPLATVAIAPTACPAPGREEHGKNMAGYVAPWEV